MKYYKTKDSYMAIREINGVDFCTHITANKVEWVLFSLVNYQAVECEKSEVISAWTNFQNKIQL